MEQESSLAGRERERLRTQYAEIATLAGGLAHEIRNPLSTIGMNLELLAEDLAEPGTLRERRMLQKILLLQQECENLEGKLNDFLQFTRAGELELQDVDLNDQVTSFINFYQPLADEHRIEITPHLAANLPLVRLDASLMRQVWMNLAQNAVQAMPDGGRLELQTYVRNGRVSIDLIDNGSGMSEHVREGMFEAFFSTKPGGSGLGLPTVRKIVEAHDGTITCESEPGRGTRFSISLPVAR